MARETTDDDFIDPELKDVQRLFFKLDWEFYQGQTLSLVYLDQTDNSSSYQTGQFIDSRKIDEEDADLNWQGISYLGEFSLISIGGFEYEFHYARVDGTSTLFDFEDPVAGQSEVAEIEKSDISGSAHGYFLGWKPEFIPHFTLIAGRATGSGDNNPDDNRDKSYRHMGLQGDTEIFGELYQPELSNLDINLIGVKWRMNENLELALFRYDYRQRKLSDELRDVSLEVDPTGTSKDLGQELDLVISLEQGGLEFIVTVAEFKPGRAYAPYSRETSNFINLEMAYEF